MAKDLNVSHPFLVGKNLYLRPLEAPDLDGPYLDWINDYSVTRFLEAGLFPNTREGLEQYVRSVSQNPQNVMLAIIDKDTDKHIGNIKLGPINWIHRFADIGILIGEKGSWGKGYATEAIKLVVDYAFNKLNLHKLTAGSYDVNLGSVRAFMKAGFAEEGLRRSQYYCNGQYVNEILVGIVRSAVAHE